MSSTGQMAELPEALTPTDDLIVPDPTPIEPSN